MIITIIVINWFQVDDCKSSELAIVRIFQNNLNIKMMHRAQLSASNQSAAFTKSSLYYSPIIIFYINKSTLNILNRMNITY